MKIKEAVLFSLLAGCAAGGARAAAAGAESPRVRKAVAAAEEAAARVKGLESLAEDADGNAEAKAISKAIRKARSLAEAAATDGDEGVKEGLEKVGAALGRAEEGLKGLDKAPEAVKAALGKAGKQAGKSRLAVMRLIEDTAAGKLPAKKDPLEVFGNSPPGGGPTRSPVQETKTGRP